MFDIEDAKSLFEYLLRKKLQDTSLPQDGAKIKSEDKYYEISWSGLSPLDLWDKLVVTKHYGLEDLDRSNALEEFFIKVLTGFRDSLSLISTHTGEPVNMNFGQLSEWSYVKKIPKKKY